MPRDISGVYTLPAPMPVQPRTIPVTNIFNTVLADVKDALNNIPGDALAPGSVGTTQLEDNSVTNAKMADNAINTAELVDGAVTNAKMAANSVDTAELVDGAVTYEKLGLNPASMDLLAPGSMAGKRDALGLGTAALADVQGSDYGETGVLKVGSFGLGRPTPEYIADFGDRLIRNGWYVYNPNALELPPGSGYGNCLIVSSSSGGGSSTWVNQLIFSTDNNTVAYRTSTNLAPWNSWSRFFHERISSALPISGSLSPATDNSVTYGTGARRPSQLYAVTSTINTSDAREKTPVRALTEQEYAAGLQLAREIGAFQWLHAVSEKGEGARVHIGQTVQRAIEIFEANGLDPFAYGALCHDSWEEEVNEDGVVTQEAGDRYSWRGEELLFLMVAAQQRALDTLLAAQ